MKEKMLYEMAVTKGMKAVPDNVNGDFYALCSIQRWLMDFHEIYIAVLPFFGGFSFIAAKLNRGRIAPNSFDFGGYSSWYEAWLTAIEEALNILPCSN